MATVLRRTAETNVSENERWLSLLGGSGLVAYGLVRRDKAGLALAALGGGLMWRGASGHCGMYQTLGINTSDRGYAKGTGSKAGVPYELGIRVDHEMRIARPVHELYGFWRNLENLPRFMRHLEHVKVIDERRSHWVVKGPAHMSVGWDAEIVNEVENQVIGWRSLPGSQVDIGGSVRFESGENGESIVRVSLQYNPPAGVLGAMLARRFGEDPREQIREDLCRFKELMETGTISKCSDQTRRTGDVQWKSSKSRSRAWDRDNVSDASEESFPASDAPSWTPEAL